MDAGDNVDVAIFVSSAVRLLTGDQRCATMRRGKPAHCGTSLVAREFAIGDAMRSFGGGTKSAFAVLFVLAVRTGVE